MPGTDTGVIRPRCRLRPGTRRAAVAALLARPEGATVQELFAAYGLPPEAPIRELQTRLYPLAMALGRPIGREGLGRGARYFLLNP